MIFTLMKERNYDEIGKLIEQGNLDLSQLNEYGNSPLHVACELGDARLVELLLNSGLEYDIDAEQLPGQALFTQFKQQTDQNDQITMPLNSAEYSAE